MYSKKFIKCTLRQISKTITVLLILFLLFPINSLYATNNNNEIAGKTENRIAETLEIIANSSFQNREDQQQFIYSYALTLFHSRCFKEASACFQKIQNYRDSTEMIEFCLMYPYTERIAENKLITEEHIDYVYPAGILYDHPYGKFYIPDQLDTTTTFQIYHSGGSGVEDCLFYDGLYDYFFNYNPNAIMFFTNNSGYNRINEKNIEMYEIMQQIAYECKTVVHDLSLVGSSNGSYTAMKAVPLYYEKYGVRVTSVSCLDAGNEWEDYHALTASECAVSAEAGTVFYLFEQQKAGMNYEGIRRIVENNNNTWLVICRDGNHDHMSENAYVYGIFSWAAGEYVNYSLPSFEYYFVQMYPDMGATPHAQFL